MCRASHGASDKMQIVSVKICQHLPNVGSNINMQSKLFGQFDSMMGKTIGH